MRVSSYPFKSLSADKHGLKVMAVFSQLCERVNYEGCWKYWSRGPQVRSDKTALVSSPITTGIRLMSLLSAIPAAKL